jgi:hypothetical protein
LRFSRLFIQSTKDFHAAAHGLRYATQQPIKPLDHLNDPFRIDPGRSAHVGWIHVVLVNDEVFLLNTKCKLQDQFKLPVLHWLTIQNRL